MISYFPEGMRGKVRKRASLELFQPFVQSSSRRLSPLWALGCSFGKWQELSLLPVLLLEWPVLRIFSLRLYNGAMWEGKKCSPERVYPLCCYGGEGAKVWPRSSRQQGKIRTQGTSQPSFVHCSTWGRTGVLNPIFPPRDADATDVCQVVAEI